MGARTFRVTVSFDEEKERDLIETVEYLAERRQLGIVSSNLLRKAVDDKTIILDSLTTPSLSVTRQKFFDWVVQVLKAQAERIDKIYSMGSDMYVLARANKAMGLEGKVDNLMTSQFLLKRQQSKIQEILGLSDSQHLFESDKLLNEKEKADKTWEYIAEVYEEMIAELRPYVFMAMNNSQGGLPGRATDIYDPKGAGIIVDKARGYKDSMGKYIPADDDIIDLSGGDDSKSSEQKGNSNSSSTESKADNDKINLPTTEEDRSLLLKLMNVNG